MLAAEHMYIESKYHPICLRKTKSDFKPAKNIVQIGKKIKRKKISNCSKMYILYMYIKKKVQGVRKGNSKNILFVERIVDW